MKKCPYCGEEVQDAAVKCKHCKKWLQKRPEPRQATTSQPQQFQSQKPPMSTPLKEKSSSAQPGPSGVGGWLMLLILGLMVFGPLLGAGKIGGGFMGAEQQTPELKTWTQYNTYKSATWVVFLAFAALSFYGGLGLASGTEWSVVRRAKIILWIIGPVSLLVMSVLLPIVFIGTEAVDSARFIGSLIGSAIGVGIWTAYLNKSKRVRNTYG